MTAYLIIKSLHLISVISWMAGMLYLPRLFVYHTKAAVGSEMDLTFQTMERRLLRIIINPAMIATFVFGFWLIYIVGFSNLGHWLHLKLLLVTILAALHGYLAYARKQFATGKNTKSEVFYRILNEVPALIMIIVVFLAVTKPF